MAWKELRAGALGRHLLSNRIDPAGEPWVKVACMRVGTVDDVSGLDSASGRSQSVSIAGFADCSHWGAGLDVEFGWEFVSQARSIAPLQTCRASSRTTAGTSGSVVTSRYLLSCKRVGAIDGPDPIITTSASVGKDGDWQLDNWGCGSRSQKGEVCVYQVCRLGLAGAWRVECAGEQKFLGKDIVMAVTETFFLLCDNLGIYIH